MWKQQVILGFSFIALSRCHSLPVEPQVPVHHPAYLISLDGVRPDHIRAFLDAEVLTPQQGLASLIATGQVSYHAFADGITLTSASHMSILTCTPPSQHGVVANTFYRREPSTHELMKVNGFTLPPSTEPFWRTLKHADKRVLSLGYPGSGTGTAEQQPDVWVGYPPLEKLVPPHVEILRWSKLSPARDWVLSNELNNLHIPPSQMREADLTIRLSPETNETRIVHVLVLSSPEPQIYFDDDKDLANGHYGVLTENHPGFIELFYTELNPRSTTREYKRHIAIRWLQQNHSDEIRLAVSASTYNHAWPEAFRKDLDRTNLVWPDWQIPTVGNERVSVSPLEFVEWQYRLNRFLVDASEVAHRYGPYDLVLFYQPMLDAFGHFYESQLPDPFAPQQASPAMEGYKLAMRLINHNVHDLIKDDLGFSPIVVVGDHGMESLETEVNLAHVLPHVPKEITLQTADATLLIYSDLTPQKWQRWYTNALGRLGDLRYKNRPVLTAHVERPADLKNWDYGEAQAVLFAGSHTQFIYKPERLKNFESPKNNGTHGYPMMEPEMETLVVVNAPNLAHALLPGISLRDVVPTLAELMKTEAPAQCLGHPVKLLPR